MTSKQKAAQNTFKKVVKEATALRKKNKSLTQPEAIKQAWAIHYSNNKKVGATKKSNTLTKVKRVLKKDKKILSHGYTLKKGNVRLSGSVGENHKDNKSHNVNIRVVSGIPITADRLTRITNDRNGNGRYVLHFLDILNDSEMQLPLSEKYKTALKKAKKIGGKKYDTKAYGGGIVFQSNSAEYLLQLLNDQKRHGDIVQLSRGKRKLGASNMPGIYKDPALAEDIILFADNDVELYNKYKYPRIKKLYELYKKGKFNIDQAERLFARYVYIASEKYRSLFKDKISAHDRKLMAKEIALDIYNEFRYNEHIPNLY